MRERVLTPEEGGLLLALLWSCGWDDPRVEELVALLGDAREIVVRQH